MKFPNRSAIAAGAALLCAAFNPAHATDGMLMEGYGPIATAMGGAAQAIDHGTAAMAMNPATLSLMPTRARHDAAFGMLGPDVKTNMPGMASAKSGGTSYFMPALGYARRSRDGSVVYGFGVFAQGGMGTEYAADSFLAMGSGEPVRSELGVGSLLFPVAWRVSPTLAVGATVDWMWAGLDLRMAASGAQLGALVTGASGNLGAALPALAGAPWARVDFSNSSDFTGRARATGWGGKLGLVWQPAADLTLGLSYRLKSSLKDMSTSMGGASLSATGGFSDSGRMTVVDFQWPAVTAVGLAWQISPGWLLAADVRRIAWADVMGSFRMRYDSAGMGGSVSFELPQAWKDQTVTALGLAWSMSEQLTLRAGLNVAANPIPEALVNPLFPATVKRHLTLGAGWRFGNANELNASLTHAPRATVVNGSGLEISHGQTNVQLMYSYRFH
ncbi:MAG: outer membrane protein transport protein [Rubrivivax sp.]|nr:outer membrane protein transport protein [Rubrivivax sp.]